MIMLAEGNKSKQVSNYIKYKSKCIIIQNDDLFCVSETHANETDIQDIPNCTFGHKHRFKEYKRK